MPKGPSLNPDHKRLAVQVEDHPLEYANFEGRIPEGQYGAGQVIVWDNGLFIPTGDASASLKRGKFEFELVGSKLKGKWALIRMKMREDNSNNLSWLLIKENDKFATRGPEITEVEHHSVISNRMI